jgi:hypothetical protein
MPVTAKVTADRLGFRMSAFQVESVGTRKASSVRKLTFAGAGAATFWPPIDHEVTLVLN